MTLWKQRLIARYSKPADDNGSDTGGTGTGATESAIEALGDDPNAPEADDTAAGDEPTGETADPRARMADFLDQLNGDKKPEEGATDAANKPQAEDKPTEAPKPEGENKPEAPKPEQEEAELLDGVKSERGKERVRQVFSENKALKTEIQEFQTLVKSTGMSAEQFAQTLEFGRLMSSGKPENLQVAAEMIERQRALIYQALGKEAPGVDLLADFPDLKDRVDNLDMTREAAVELAKHRRTENQRQAAEQAQRQAGERQTQLQQTVTSAAAQMDAYLQTRAQELDHPARMAELGKKFQDPAFMQEFVTTYQPQQWGSVIKMMYDSIKPAAAPAPRIPEPQPLRSRNRSLGNPAPAANASPLDRVASRLDAMGI